ncbi:MAG: hypothetical protein H6557_04940 [Lewinellaceae bacterium]|nr:hypothetical protein [Lewinellaceae bacterium]
MVWKQIIQYVETKKYKDLILITDDNKEDWWWKKRGKTYGPHKSLIEELKKETTVEKFWMYNSLGFLENAKIYLKANIKDNTIETVKEVITSSKRGKLNKLELPEYYIPILSVLFEAEDGKLTVQECIEKVEPIVKDKLQEDDYEELPSTGELRWHNNVKWARNDLRKLGLISSDSPRGVWEITENGVDYLEKNK